MRIQSAQLQSIGHVPTNLRDSDRPGCGTRCTYPSGSIRKVAVHGGAGDAQHLGDVGGVDALLPKTARLRGMGVVDLAGTATLAPVGGSRSETGAGGSIMVSRSGVIRRSARQDP